MKINDRVYVSVLSKSKVAGEVGVVRAISARGEVKVENDFGVVGYPNIRHCKVNTADAPTKSDHVTKHIIDTDVMHMYTTPILPINLAEKMTDEQKAKYLNALAHAGVVEKDPTDLLCKAITFNNFFTGAVIAGIVSDQWISEGIELLNVVHNGTYTVIPRAQAKTVLKRLVGKTYATDYYL